MASSVDGDAPAHKRYTEARLMQLSEEFIKETNKETVDFQFNFDDYLKEHMALLAEFPNH